MTLITVVLELYAMHNLIVGQITTNYLYFELRNKSSCYSSWKVSYLTPVNLINHWCINLYKKKRNPELEITILKKWTINANVVNWKF